MKKAMIVVAMMAMAITASATTLKWGLTSGQYLDETKVDAGTMYLCHFAGTADWTLLANQAYYSASTITDVLGMSIVSTGDGEASFAYSKTTGTVGASTFITPTDLGTTAGKFYYICIDDGAKNIAYTATVTAQTINAQVTQVGKTKLASAFSYAEAAAIPEPTSGLLLLLGMGALALRRRRA